LKKLSFYNNNAVTQQTDINTAVSLNSVTGVITTVSANTEANGTDEFTVNNDKIRSTSLISLTVVGYDGAFNSIPHAFVKSTSNGSFVVVLGNGGSAALNSTVKIFFTVLN
jgi:hypothetical protein